jgi:hypothetical protein
VGKAHTAVAGAGALGGLALDNDTNVKGLYLTDFSVAQGALQTTPSGTPVASGLFYVDPANVVPTLPIAVQKSGQYIGFQHPQGIAWSGQAYPNDFLYVAENNNIWKIDPTNGGAGLVTVGAGAFYSSNADAGMLAVTGLNFKAAATIGSGAVGMISDGAGNLIIADTGNNRIVSVSTSTMAVTVVASGHPFNSVTATATAAVYYATDTAGGVYKVSTSGAVAYGIPTGTAKDGPVGIISLGTTASAAFPYAVQGEAANFFGSASVPTVPYTLVPFSGVSPILSAGAQAAVVAGAEKLAPDTSNGTIGTTAGALGTSAVLGATAVPAATATAINTANANSALTSDSLLISGGATLHTLAY